MKRGADNQVMDDQIRQKIIENRKQMGYKQGDVVVQMQLSGLDISYDIYKNIESGRRQLTAAEFLFLAVFLNIDVSQMTRRIYAH